MPTDLPTPRPARAALAVQQLEARDVPSAGPTAGGGWTDAGLAATYYSDPNFTNAAFTRKEQRLDFDWGTTIRPGGSISPGFRDVGADNFSARFSGQLIPRHSETYAFTGAADDVFTLELKRATDATWTTVVSQATAGSFSGSMALTAGERYDVRASFKEFTVAAQLRLRWSSPSTPSEVVDTLTQSGINNPDGGAAFADIVKGGRNSWEGVDGQPRPGTDASGWPTGNGAYVFQESLNQGLDVDPLMRGKVAFSLKGKADVSVMGNVQGGSLTQGYDAGTNTTSGTFVVRNNGWNASYVQFRNTSRTGAVGGPGGFTDFRMMRVTSPDAATNYSADTVFTSHIKDAMGRFNVLRFQLVANQQKEWADRTLPSHFNQAGGSRTAPYYGVGDASDNGWSWEHKVLLANETGRDLMLSIPTVATGRTPADVNSYVAKLANLIRYGSDGVNPYTSPQANPVYPPLNPNLRVYLELENELWNFGGVFYVDYANLNKITNQALAAGGADAQALNYDNRPLVVNGNGDYNDIHTFRLRMAMLRTVQISDIFRGVFGDTAMPGTAADPRVRPVYQWQYDNLNGTASIALRFADQYFNNGDGVNHVATPRPLNHYLWGAGGAAYYGANNGNGLTDLLPNPGFDTVAVAGGYNPGAAAGGWTFAGTAGVARDAGTGDDIPAPFNGAQLGYVAGAGRATATFTVPATQTSNVYAVSFKAHNRKKTGAANADAQNLRVYLDYGTVNQVDVTARTFSQGNGYTPPGAGSITPWRARNVFWTESEYYYTKSADLAPGSTHTVTVVGTGAADQLAFLEDVRVTSVDAVFAGGIPGGGEAAGQPAGQNIKNVMNTEADWANAFGLRHIAYESGWSLGGDDGGSYVQLKAKYGDPRTAGAQGRFMDYYHESGAEVNVFGTYAQWPSWADYYAEQGLLNAGAYPIVQGVTDQANRLPNVATNGTAVAASGATTVAPVASLLEDWVGAQGQPQFAVNRRVQYAFTLLVGEAGTYTLGVTLANAAAGGALRVLVDGVQVGTLSVPNSGGQAAFQDAGAFAVTLTKGRHAVLLTPLANSPAGYAANVNALKVTRAATARPPASPTGLVASTASVSAVNLSWTDNSSSETGFQVERSTDPTFASAATFSLAANSTTYTDMALAAGTTYYYRVRAVSGAGASAWSATAQATTQPAPTGTGLARFEFTGLSGAEPSAPAAPGGPAAVSSITRGPGLKPTTYTGLAGNTFGSEAADNVYAQTLAAAVAAGDYTEFTVTPAAGQALSLAGLTFRPYFQNAGGANDPRGAGVAFRVGSGAFGAPLLAAGTPSPTPNNGTPYTVNLAGQATLQGVTAAVTVRVYLFGNGVYEFTGLGGPGDDVALTGTSAPAAPALGLFTTAQDVGDPGQAGSTAYAASTGTYTVRGGGSDIWGGSDQFHFAHKSVTGDQTLVARVTGVENTDAWAKAGVMFRAGAGGNAQYAAVEVTPGNGVRFQWRTTTGAGAADIGVGVLAAPVWVKLARAGDVFTAYYATTAGAPAAGDWVALGAPQPIAFPTGGYLAGLAVTAHNNAALSTATFTDVTLSNAAAKLSGAILGTAGSWNNGGNTRDKAFDGDLNSFFDAPDAASGGAWVGLDLGSAFTLAQVRFAPRAGFEGRMVGGRFQASNSADFAGAVDIHTVAAAPPAGSLTAAAASAPGAFRYVRYLAPASSWGNVAEAEFWGEPA